MHNRAATPGLRVRLSAGADNPLGIGARVRLLSSGRAGPVRELHAGSGYWSMDGATTVIARPRPSQTDSLWVRWPGGRVQTVPLAIDQRELSVRAPDAASSPSGRRRVRPNDAEQSRRACQR